MTRLRAWTGSRWSDVSVWDGTRWKGYEPPVYGAPALEYGFNGGNDGWTSDPCGDGVQMTQVWHGNGHIYIGGTYAIYDDANHQITGQSIKFSVAPGGTIRAQAHVWMQLATDGNGYGGSMAVGAYFTGPTGYAESCSMNTSVSFEKGGWGWGWITTDLPLSVPAGDSPVEYTFTGALVQASFAGDIMGSPWPTYNFWLDHFRLIDQNGNLLMKMTSPPTYPIKVWSGSAWV